MKGFKDSRQSKISEKTANEHSKQDSKEEKVESASKSKSRLPRTSLIQQK
jgi:hypothetical protein